MQHSHEVLVASAHLLNNQILVPFNSSLFPIINRTFSFCLAHMHPARKYISIRIFIDYLSPSLSTLICGSVIVAFE